MITNLYTHGALHLNTTPSLLSTVRKDYKEWLRDDKNYVQEGTSTYWLSPPENAQWVEYTRYHIVKYLDAGSFYGHGREKGWYYVV